MRRKQPPEGKGEIILDGGTSGGRGWEVRSDDLIPQACAF